VEVVVQMVLMAKLEQAEHLVAQEVLVQVVELLFLD